MLRQLLLVLLVSSACQASFFRISRIVRNGIKHFEESFNSNNLTVVRLTWHDCGSSDDLASIKSLSVQPDPIQIPGNVLFSLSASLNQTLTAPIKLELKVEKKKLFWVPIPCIDQMGSCDYDDICKMIDKASSCPAEFKKYHIPCHCPIHGGMYSVPSSSVHVHSFGLPSWLENGKYKVKAELTNNGRRVMCIQLSFSLK